MSTLQRPPMDGSIDADTRRLVAALEDGTLPELNHADHVRVAWAYLKSCELAGALATLPSVLRRYAASKGLPEAYHETITFAFTFLIHERVARSPEASWEEFAAAYPELLESSLLERYYDAELLGSDRARQVFLLPDPALPGR